MNKLAMKSGIELTLNLPRVKRAGKRGAVAHIMTGMPQLAGYVRDTGSVPYGPIRPPTPCHALDETPNTVWADPDDPTCKRCLITVNFLRVEKP